MASQVLSGSSNPTYTNNTGQNVRIVINFMRSISSGSPRQRISINWAGVGVAAEAPEYSRIGATGNSSQSFAIGRNLASIDFYSDKEQSATIPNPPAAVTSSLSTNNAGGAVPINATDYPDFSIILPTELMLAPGQTFSALCGTYNIVVIPEAG